MCVCECVVGALTEQVPSHPGAAPECVRGLATAPTTLACLLMELALAHYAYGYTDNGKRLLADTGNVLGLEVELTGVCTITCVCVCVCVSQTTCATWLTLQVLHLSLRAVMCKHMLRRIFAMYKHAMFPVRMQSYGVFTWISVYPCVCVCVCVTTGALGKRTVHQTSATAQLVVRAGRTRRAAPAASHDIDVTSLVLGVGTPATAPTTAPATAHMTGNSDSGDSKAQMQASEGAQANSVSQATQETAGLSLDEDVYLAPQLVDAQGHVSTHTHIHTR